jgi:hypothetical protein
VIFALAAMFAAIAGATVRAGVRRDPLPVLLAVLFLPMFATWAWWLALGEGDGLVRWGLVYLTIVWAACFVLGAVLAQPVPRAK